MYITLGLLVGLFSYISGYYARILDEGLNDYDEDLIECNHKDTFVIYTLQKGEK